MTLLLALVQVERLNDCHCRNIEQRSANPSTTSSRRRRLALLHTAGLASSTHAKSLLNRFVPTLLRLLLALPARAVPVPHHLHSQHKVKRKSNQVSVQNQLVIHLLQCREDSRQRSRKEVEDLARSVSIPSHFQHVTLTAKALNCPVLP